MKHGKSSKEILSTSAKLSSLVNKTLYLEKLEKHLSCLLPPLLYSHCSVANVRQSVLIVHVDAASWGMQLRFYTTQLLSQLRQEKDFAPIHSIKYKIRLNEKLQATMATTKPSLSQHNKALLTELQQLLAEKTKLPS